MGETWRWEAFLCDAVIQFRIGFLLQPQCVWIPKSTDPYKAPGQLASDPTQWQIPQPGQTLPLGHPWGQDI